MKKNKGSKNFVIIVITLFFALASLALYRQSIGIKVLEKVNYSEDSNVRYRVHVTDKKYYNAEYLDEGRQYISEIIDYIDIDFNNKVTFDKKLDYVASKQVVANVKIVDSNNEENVIYESQETLDDDNKLSNKDTNDIDLGSSIKIDYKKFNTLTNDFKSNYGISANCKLIVTYYATYIGDYKDFDDIKKVSTMKVEIPLSEQMITISKTSDVKTNDNYSQTTNTSIINKTLFIFSTLFLFLSIVLLIYLVRNVTSNSKNVSKYEKFIKKTLRKYDAYITESNDASTKGKNQINVSTFKELLDVRNNIEKAIVYVRIDDKKSKFMIIDEKEVYIYTASEEDFNN